MLHSGSHCCTCTKEAALRINLNILIFISPHLSSTSKDATHRETIQPLLQSQFNHYYSLMVIRVPKNEEIIPPDVPD